MRRNERGETFFNCLIVLVLVAGGLTWAWMKFGAHRGILRPEMVVEERANREATLRYQQRMRERYFGSSANAVGQGAGLVAAVRQGKFAADREAFEQRYFERVRELEANVSELTANRVPAQFAEGHRKLALAHRHAYEALVICRLALGEEPELQRRHYAEAGGLAEKAVREVRRGRQELEPNFQ